MYILLVICFLFGDCFLCNVNLSKSLVFDAVWVCWETAETILTICQGWKMLWKSFCLTFWFFFKDPITFVTTLLAFLTCMFIILNIFLGFAGADISVCIFTIIGVYFFRWTCVSIPLVFVGSYFGFCSGKIEVSTKTNQIAWFIPKKNAAARSIVTLVVSGSTPYINMIVEFAIIVSFCVCISLFALMPTHWCLFFF